MNSAPATPRAKHHALLAAASKTAGSDNWKTTAGRTDGPNGFVAGDAWRLLKIHFKSTTKPTVCPVCMEKPSSDDEWYITKSCRHAVCRECLQNYALSLISDANHSGPLKCPCCSRLLRVEDAKVALDKQPRSSTVSLTLSKRNVMPNLVRKRASSKHQQNRALLSDAEMDDASSALEILEKWDNKMRDELLRSMRGFRPCPHCSNCGDFDAGGSSSNAKDTDTSNMGGGFVTPDCLAPINRERETKAERLLNLAGAPSAKAVLLIYAIYYIYCGSIDLKNPALQIVSATAPCVMLPVLPHAIRLFLVGMAKRKIMCPIVVTCPCCFKDFSLEASSELEFPGVSSEPAAEVATRRWKSTNTRPCPGCGSPIMKAGGCNHVKCGRCSINFCWACMRPRTTCKAYQCRNGAPYGNAFGDGSWPAVREGLVALEREGQGRTLLERIDYIEALALRNLRQFRSSPSRYVAAVSIWCVVVSCLTIPGHVAPIVWTAIRSTLSLAANLLLPFLGILACQVIYHNMRQPRRNITGIAIREQQQNGTGGIRGPANNIHRRRFMALWTPGLRIEEEQLSEAIARSLREQ